MIALHLGGIPEIAMVLGPVLLIVAFLRIARHHEASCEDEYDDWDADLGDLPDRDTGPADLPDRSDRSELDPTDRSDPTGRPDPTDRTSRLEG